MPRYYRALWQIQNTLQEENRPFQWWLKCYIWPDWFIFAKVVCAKKHVFNQTQQTSLGTGNRPDCMGCNKQIMPCQRWTKTTMKGIKPGTCYLQQAKQTCFSQASQLQSQNLVSAASTHPFCTIFLSTWNLLQWLHHWCWMYF
jgi:hypothetical protein